MNHVFCSLTQYRNNLYIYSTGCALKIGNIELLNEDKSDSHQSPPLNIEAAGLLDVMNIDKDETDNLILLSIIVLCALVLFLIITILIFFCCKRNCNRNDEPAKKRNLQALRSLQKQQEMIAERLENGRYE